MKGFWTVIGTVVALAFLVGCASPIVAKLITVRPQTAARPQTTATDGILVVMISVILARLVLAGQREPDRAGCHHGSAVRVEAIDRLRRHLADRARVTIAELKGCS